MPLVLALLAACVGEDEEVANQRQVALRVTPTAIAALPPGIEEATLHIRDGQFGVDQLLLQEDEPTVLHVVNTDERAYRLRIVEDLVTATPIAPSTTTPLGFTTPDAGRYEGQLLAAEGDEVLDTVAVIVQSPGALQP